VGVNKLTVITESDFFFIPRILAQLLYAILVAMLLNSGPGRDEEFGMLKGYFKLFLFDILQKIRNKENVAFYLSIYSPHALIAVAEIVLAYISEEISFLALS